MSNGGYEDRQPGQDAVQAEVPGRLLRGHQLRHSRHRHRRARRPTARTWSSASPPTAASPRHDPIQLNVYAEAAADVAASRIVLLNDMKELFDHVDKGGEVTWTQRLTNRRNGVRAVHRAVDAVDRLYKMSGAQGIHERYPNERYWRDMQSGLSPHLQRLRGRLRRVGHQRPRRRALGPARLRLTPSQASHQGDHR